MASYSNMLADGGRPIRQLVVQRVLASGGRGGRSVIAIDASSSGVVHTDSEPNGDFVAIWNAASEVDEPTQVQAQRWQTNIVGDRVWHDEDGDGLQDFEEPAVAGVSVHLFDEFAQLLQSVVTDAAGAYGFTVIRPGDWYVQFELPASGWEFTTPDAGIGPLDVSDSDASPTDGTTETFFISEGVLSTRWDAGLVVTPLFADGFESEDSTAWSATKPVSAPFPRAIPTRT